MIAACVGYFMVILDTTIVNVALPSLAHGLHASTSALQWVVDGYTLFFAALLLSAGALSDRRGPKRVLEAGLGLFALSSLACGLATSVGLLIAARCVQGLGAALAVPSSLASLQAAYPDRAARARAFGVWATAGGIAAVSGPLVGGAAVSALGWRSVFLVNVPVGILGVLLAARALPSPPPRRHGGDVLGQICAIGCLGSLTAALIEAGAGGWTSAWLPAGLLLAGVFGLTFFAIENRAEQPMLPLGLFRSPSFSGATVVGLLANLGFYGQLFVLGLYFQEVRGYSPLLTGLALLPEMIQAIVGANLCGYLVARHGPRRPLLAGLAIGGVGLLGLAFAGPHTPYGLLVPALVGAGFGMSFITPAVTAAAMEAAPARREGIASGVFNAGRQVGGVLGVALLGALIAQRSAFGGGMRIAMAIAGGGFLVGLAVTALAIDRHGVVLPQPTAVES